jgi:hypothetical protein
MDHCQYARGKGVKVGRLLSVKKRQDGDCSHTLGSVGQLTSKSRVVETARYVRSSSEVFPTQESLTEHRENIRKGNIGVGKDFLYGCNILSRNHFELLAGYPLKTRLKQNFQTRAELESVYQCKIKTRRLDKVSANKNVTS